jgi:large repetitive protein
MPIGDKKGGFIRPGYDPLEVPNEPTSVSVTAGDTELEVSFTAPANTGGGAITAYQAATTTGASTTGASSPLTITGLTNDVTYNVRVWALNAYGPGPFGTGSGTPETLQRGIFAGGYNPVQ